MKGGGIVADGCGCEPENGNLGRGEGEKRGGEGRTGMTGFAIRIVPRSVGR